MKGKNYLVAIFIIISELCFGKTINIRNDTLKKTLFILYFSDKPPIATENDFIDPMAEESLKPVSDSQSKEICRLLKVDYILVVKLIPNTKVLTLSDIFSLYKIKQKYWQLPVKVNDDIIDYPETILISQNQIDKVKIVQDIKGYCINIILTGYYEIKKKYPHGGVFRLN